MFERQTLGWVSLEPRVDEHFAFITRENGALSPATRAFMMLAAEHISSLRHRAKLMRS